MLDSNLKLPSIFLMPGQGVLTRRPTLVSTVLGSCISVVMFHPGLKLGGMFHAVLPHYLEVSGITNDPDEVFRYSDRATHWLLARFLERAPSGKGLVIKLFGGSESSWGREIAGSFGVGRENVRTALKILEEAGLAPQAMDVGGATGRKLIFRSDTGEVFLKRLRRTEAWADDMVTQRCPASRRLSA